MRLRKVLAAYRQPFEAVMAVTTCRESLFFADLCWDPFDSEAELRRGVEFRDPGVIVETASRVVVIEEHCGELRFYAGGWCRDEDRIHLEQDWMETEGSEMGVFQNAEDAILFAYRYLVAEQSLQSIAFARQSLHRRDTTRVHG